MEQHASTGKAAAVAQAPSSGTQSIDRAAALLHAVVGADEPLSYTDIADGCGLARSTTSRLLSSLEHNELLTRGVDGGYVAGPLFWRYAARHDPWYQVARVAEPVMDAVRDEVGETVVLAAVRSDIVVHLHQVDSHFLLSTRDWTSVEVPSHASSLGKVVLAHGIQTMPAGELERITEHTITDHDILRAELDDVLRRGWASAVDELEIGLAGVAVPVGIPSASGNHTIAALGVSGPTARLAGRGEDIGGQLITQAARLTEQLSARRPGKEGAP